MTPIVPLIPEQTWEVKSACNHGNCSYYWNSYCDYPSPGQSNPYATVAGGSIQGHFHLACPNNSFSAPPVMTSGIQTLAGDGRYYYVDFGVQIGNSVGPTDGDALAIWRGWASACGQTVSE